MNTSQWNGYSAFNPKVLKCNLQKFGYLYLILKHTVTCHNTVVQCLQRNIGTKLIYLSLWNIQNSILRVIIIRYTSTKV